MSTAASAYRPTAARQLRIFLPRGPIAAPLLRISPESTGMMMLTPPDCQTTATRMPRRASLLWSGPSSGPQTSPPPGPGPSSSADNYVTHGPERDRIV